MLHVAVTHGLFIGNHREFLCVSVSRSGLIRSLKRHGVGNLNALKPAKPNEPHIICNYVRQSKALGLGHAVLCAEPLVGNKAFAVLLVDDLMIGLTPTLQ